MKQVIISDTPKIIALSELTNDSHIGIDWGNNRRAMVIKKAESIYTTINSELDITHHWVEITKLNVVEKALTRQNAGNVFVFDSKQDLIKWFSTTD